MSVQKKTPKNKQKKHPLLIILNALSPKVCKKQGLESQPKLK